MKPIGAFFVPLSAAFIKVLSGASLGIWAGAVPVFALTPTPPDSGGVRFRGDPAVERFPGGALQVSAEIACPEPAALLGARVEFGFDFGLEGAFEPAGTSALSPGDCEGGALTLRRDLFPPAPALLRMELRSAVDSLDARLLPAGHLGSLLAVRRFCARPRNGEPEWIEVANLSSRTVSLARVKLEGRALSGSLAPGEGLTVGGASDTAELRLWQPGARLFATSSWSPLRNSGDTLRLAWWQGARAIALDSVFYGAAASTREGCASAAVEEAAAAAHGFALQAPPRWRRSVPGEVVVQAPSHAAYSLRAYDPDGRELCVLARGAAGPGRFPLSPGCVPPSLPAVILHLEPRGAPPARVLLRVAP